MTYQTQMITKGIARSFNNIVINGLPSDLKNPVGLWHRTLYDLASTQRINASVDISPDASSLSTAIQNMIDKLDELLYAVNDSIEIGEAACTCCATQPPCSGSTRSSARADLSPRQKTRSDESGWNTRARSLSTWV